MRGTITGWRARRDSTAQGSILVDGKASSVVVGPQGARIIDESGAYELRATRGAPVPCPLECVLVDVPAGPVEAAQAETGADGATIASAMAQLSDGLRERPEETPLLPEETAEADPARGIERLVDDWLREHGEPPALEAFLRGMHELNFGSVRVKTMDSYPEFLAGALQHVLEAAHRWANA